MKTYEEVRKAAAERLEKCRACPVCDTSVCAGQVPGTGGKGTGSTSVRNCRFWSRGVLFNQNVLVDEKYAGEPFVPDTSCEILGKKLSLPVIPAPVGLVSVNLGPLYDDVTYTEELLKGSEAAGTVAFTGGGLDRKAFTDPLSVIEKTGIKGIPTVKPLANDIVLEQLETVASLGVGIVAMDIDSAGLPHATLSETPMYMKCPSDIKLFCERAHSLGMKFIVKGIMTPESGYAAAEAGADAIVVSNHGGRVLDGGLSSGEVLQEISRAVKGRTEVLVDGGIRTGADVVKAMALGADGVLVGRPVSVAIYGGGAEGLELWFEKIKSEMKEVMKMTGCRSTEDICEKTVKVVF